MGSATAHHQVLSRSVKLTAFDPGGLHAGAPHAHHEAGRAREFLAHSVQERELSLSAGVGYAARPPLQDRATPSV